MPPLPTTIAAVTVRTRRATTRLRPWWWVATLVLAAGAAWGVATAVRDAAAAAEAWGSQVDVLVVVDDVAAGGPIETRILAFPSAMLPDDAVIATDRPRELHPDATARHDLAAGEVLVAGDIEPGGVVGRIPAGWRAITVREHRPSGAAVGERVDVVGDGLVLATGAHVIDVVPADQMVTLAIEPATAPAVAVADTTSTITLLRRR